MNQLQRRLLTGMVSGAACSLLLASQPALAQRSKGEASLLGVKLYSKFSDVLKKFGQPSEIQAGDAFLSEMATEDSLTAGSGASTPGLPGMPGAPGARGTSSGGGQQPYGGYGSGGGRSGGGPPAGYGGGNPNGGGGNGGGQQPYGGYGSGGRSGGPTPGGRPGQPGASGTGGRGGYGAQGGDSAGGAGDNPKGSQPNELGEYVETTWWYHIKKRDAQKRVISTVHYSFLFNKDGRVIQISEYGYSSPYKTAKGVALGTSLDSVMRGYGFGVDGERTGEDLVMRFPVPVQGIPSTLGFQMRKNRVVGITMAVVKSPQAPRPEGEGGEAPGAPE